MIRRQEVGSEKSDQDELSAASLGEDGRVAFQFRNQAWPELIDWLAELSDQPLDWLELPADRVNITTPGRYTVAEVIDLFNRHLLGRGYTLLSLDGGMTVVKCSAINPAIVPRFDQEQLGALPPHSFVRTSLDAGWLSAEKLAEEFKAMISENGKLTALTTTNRIEAMDAAVTLHQVAELLRRELDGASRESLAPEFKLRHIPAEEAKRLLEEFLGIGGKPEPPLSPQEQQQRAQMMQMRAQQGGQPPTPEPKKPDIAVVANARQNSILIQAPPDRVAIATEFLKRIDVPGATMTSLSDVQNRVQVFRLVSLDPAKLIEIVQEMNILEPSTRIRVDSDNRALIVSGSAADRFIIQQIITRLDGSGRSFEVLQLRRLDAAEVAESITFLMGKKPDKDESRNQRYPMYFGGMSQPEAKKEDEFRVAANTRYRQVLLWANDSEMAEVRNLLVKLGELPPPTGNDRMLRVIDADPSPETFRYLQELQRQWQQVSPNPIELPPVDRFLPKEKSPEDDPADKDAAPDSSSADLTAAPGGKVPPSIRLTAAPQTAAVQVPAAERATNENEAAATETDEVPPPEPPVIRSLEDFDRAFAVPGRVTKPDESAPGNAPPPTAATTEPIQIEVDAAGNLVLRSRDTAALDRLEDLMLQFTPPRRAYHTFVAKHVSATWIRLSLEDFFAEDDDDDTSSGFPRWLFGFDDRKTNSPSGLGKPAKLRFISDIDTGTIVVSNATAEQLKTIEDLIRLWDVPEPINDRKVRYTRLVPLRHSRATAIAETIKETYRDLLSSNDKAFQAAGGQGGGGQGGGSGMPPRSAGGGRSPGGGSELVDTGGSGQQGGGADFSFKGKLSIGIDPIGNTLLVSAEGEALLKLVCDMIDQLDIAARTSDGVQVVNLPATINASYLEAALRTMQTGSATPPQQQNVAPQQPAPAPAAENRPPRPPRRQPSPAPELD
ncbi:MAG: hypothetical protein EA381_03180 [Planctomycetaceae bacterium]|nr:MAG: hypothetical protein EA381_03180 [Planctomycetaceae bacterium]